MAPNPNENRRVPSRRGLFRLAFWTTVGITVDQLLAACDQPTRNSLTSLDKTSTPPGGAQGAERVTQAASATAGRTEATINDTAALSAAKQQNEATPIYTETPIPENALDLAEKLGWYEFTDERIIIQDTPAGQILQGHKSGVMGFEDIESGQWRSTKGWLDMMRKSGKRMETARVTDGSPYLFESYGVVGKLIEKKFTVITPESLLGISDFAYWQFGIDKKGRLGGQVIPVVMTNMDGEVVVTDSSWEENLINVGLPISREGAIKYYRDKIMFGRWVSYRSFDSIEGVEDSRRRYASSHRGTPVDSEPSKARLKTLIEASLEGGRDLLGEIVNGSNNGGIVIPSAYSSLVYQKNPKIINLP